MLGRCAGLLMGGEVLGRLMAGPWVPYLGDLDGPSVEGRLAWFGDLGGPLMELRLAGFGDLGGPALWRVSQLTCRPPLLLDTLLIHLGT